MTPSRAILFQGRLLRRSLRRWQARLRWRRLSLQGVPVLFANSFPKSGTHLLTQVLSGLTKLGPAVESGLPAIVTYKGDTGRTRSTREILADLQRFEPGDIGYGHLHALPEIVERLCRPDFCAYFILRDPRDVVVSHVHYVSEMASDHILHRYYATELEDFSARLRTSILGLPQAEFAFPDVQARFEPYLGWLERPEVLTLQYEALIQERELALGRIWQHAQARGFASQIPEAESIARLNQAIDPARSPTFRQGRTGGWMNHFGPADKALFKKVAGDLLIHLGYEAGYDW